MTEFDLFPGQAGGGRGSEHTRKHQFGWFSFLFLFFASSFPFLTSPDY